MFQKKKEKKKKKVPLISEGVVSFDADWLRIGSNYLFFLFLFSRVGAINFSSGFRVVLGSFW